MASADKGKAAFISLKLKFLKDKGDHLIDDIRLYVNRIIAAGESWAEGGDKQLEYMELCQIIDHAVGFLCQTCEELAGEPIGVAENQLSRSSCEQTDLTSQSMTATASTSAASNIQLAVPIQPVDETQMKPVLARIAVIEEALCSFRFNAEKVAEQQSGIDQQLNELLCKLTESDKKHSSRFRKVKEQISEISDVQDAINEHKKRLQSLERQLQKVSTAQDRLDKEAELQAELAEKLVHLPNQQEVVKENVDVLDSRIERMTDECRIKHEDVKTVTDDLLDKVTANTHAIQDISEGQEQKMTLLRELETRLKTLEANGGRHVKDFQKQAEKGEANLSQVIQEVAVMSPRLQQLELKASGTGFGFTAHRSSTKYGIGRTITQYHISHSTVGNNFDANTGVFTAPCDGLYVASVSIKLDGNTELEVSVGCQQNLNGAASSPYVCSAAVASTEACSLPKECLTFFGKTTFLGRDGGFEEFGYGSITRTIRALSEHLSGIEDHKDNTGAQ